MKIEEMIQNTFKKGWDIFKNQFVVLIIGTVVAILMMIFVVTIPPMIFGIYYLCVQLVKGKKIKISNVFKGFNYFFRSWGILLLGLIIIALGFVALIIPGLLLIVLYQYAIAFAIMEDTGVIASLKRSFAVAKANFAFSAVLIILLTVIESIGGLTRVGILLTMPFTTLVTCIAAHELSKPTKRKK
jgi:uncharacterized membrane protein